MNIVITNRFKAWVKETYKFDIDAHPVYENTFVTVNTYHTNKWIGEVPFFQYYEEEEARIILLREYVDLLYKQLTIANHDPKLEFDKTKYLKYAYDIPELFKKAILLREKFNKDYPEPE